MNAKQIAKALVPWALGLAGGIAVTYGVLSDRCMMLTVDELEDILRETAEEAATEAVISQYDSDDEDDMGALAYISPAAANPAIKMIQDAVEEAEEISKYQGYLEENEPMAPSEANERPVSLVISAEEYVEENSFTKREVKFLKGYSTMLDENDEPINPPDVEALICKVLIGFLETAEDNAYVYARNEESSVDLEIEIIDSEESEVIIENLQ